MAADIPNRNFSLTEVCALLALDMGDWNAGDGEKAFIEMGGDKELFARSVARLVQDGILGVREGTRTASPRINANGLFDALELKHRQAQADRLLAALNGQWQEVQ